MNVTRTNPSLTGLGCSNCGGEDDCFGAAAHSGFQVAAMQSGANPMGMNPAQWQWTPPSSPTLQVGPMPPPGAPTANNPMVWANNGYPTSLNRPGSAAGTIAQTSPDYPTPTALTIAQAFQGANPGDVQPGYVNMPNLNWTADNLSFVKPLPGAAQTCPAANAVNTNPLLFIVGVFAIAYFLGKPNRRAA